MKIKITVLNFSPLNSLGGFGLLVPDEVEPKEQVNPLKLLGLASEEYFKCFAALTLGLLEKDVPRWEEQKVLLDPKVFSMIFLWWGEARVLLGPFISLHGSNEAELKEEWLGSRWELKIFLVEGNLEEWRWKKSLFLILNGVFFSVDAASEESKLEVESELKDEDSKDELKSEGEVLKGFLEV